MSRSFEERWAATLDSDQWRRITGSAAGRAVRRSSAFRGADTARRFVVTRLGAVADRDLFGDVHTLCITIGHVKSGGSLLGAMLDAHPNAAFADDLDALRYVRAGFEAEQVFRILVKGARREVLKGRVTARRLEPYSLFVPGGWQGSHRTLEVVGFSRAGPTTRGLSEEPDVLAGLRRTLGSLRPAFVHVVRHPADPVAAMVLRSGRSLDSAVRDYAEQCDRLLALRSRLPAEDLLTVRYERFVRAPREGLVEACGFLGLAVEADHLDACGAVIRDDMTSERDRIEWTSRATDSTRRLIDRVDFLEPYRDG